MKSIALIKFAALAVTSLTSIYSCQVSPNNKSIIGNWYRVDTVNNAYYEYYIDEHNYTTFNSFLMTAIPYKYLMKGDTIFLYYENGNEYDSYIIDWYKSNRKEINFKILRNGMNLKLNKLDENINFYNINYWENDSINMEFMREFHFRYLDKLSETEPDR